MSVYAKHLKPESFSQTERLPNTNQTRNSAGGYSYQADDWTRLRRFLVLGSEGRTYYASEKALTRENAAVVERCFGRDPKKTVDEIVGVSIAGRAPKNDPAVFALALCASQMFDPNKFTPATEAVFGTGRDYALSKLTDVCRTGTHLFQFVETVNSLRGWGTALRKAVARWYTDKSPDDLAYQVTKYAQRNGWSHRDVLRLCHAASPTHDPVFRYVTHGYEALMPDREGFRIVKGEKVPFRYPGPAFMDASKYPDLLDHVDEVRKATDAKEVARLVRDHGLVREVIPTQFLNSPDVWDALLHAGEFGMPLTALVRNLGKMTSIGLISPLSATERFVVERLADQKAMKAGRVHPLQFLVALSTYRQGRGEKGKLSWTPSQAVVAALDRAFSLAFGAVEPTGKRFLIALDVSGSMGFPSSHVCGTSLTAREAAAALALVTLRTEPYCHVIGFTGRGYVVNSRPSQARYLNYGAGSLSGSGVEPLNISAATDLATAVREVTSLPMGPTDCALPWLYAADSGIQADVCLTFTDSETWYGDVHPSVALAKYRDKTGIAAKNVVVGMVANQFTIADPNDTLSMDVVGFDTSVPQVISEFVRQ